MQEQSDNSPTSLAGMDSVFSAEKLLEKLGVGGLDNIAKTEAEKKVLMSKLIEIQVSNTGEKYSCAHICPQCVILA